MPIIYSSSTLTARCRSAAQYTKEYKDDPYGYWLALGKTTPWPDEDNPPVPSISISRVSELYGFFWVHLCSSVYADPQGEIQTYEGNFTKIDTHLDTILSAAKANRVYMESLIKPEDLPLGFTFRMRALCSKLEFIQELDSRTLKPGHFEPMSNIKTYVLDWISTHPPITKTININNISQVIREF